MRGDINFSPLTFLLLPRSTPRSVLSETFFHLMELLLIQQFQYIPGNLT